MKSAFAGADLGHPVVMSCSWIGRVGVEGHRSLAQTRRSAAASKWINYHLTGFGV